MVTALGAKLNALRTEIVGPLNVEKDTAVGGKMVNVPLKMLSMPKNTTPTTTLVGLYLNVVNLIAEVGFLPLLRTILEPCVTTSADPEMGNVNMNTDLKMVFSSLAIVLPMTMMTSFKMDLGA